MSDNPSGWQQRIAAMPSGAAYVHVEIRDEAGAVLDSFNVDAKDALPPTSSDWQPEPKNIYMAGWREGWDAGKGSTHTEPHIHDAMAAWERSETKEATEIRALPPAPEPAKHDWQFLGHCHECGYTGCTVCGAVQHDDNENEPCPGNG